MTTTLPPSATLASPSIEELESIPVLASEPLAPAELVDEPAPARVGLWARLLRLEHARAARTVASRTADGDRPRTGDGWAHVRLSPMGNTVRSIR